MNIDDVGLLFTIVFKVKHKYLLVEYIFIQEYMNICVPFANIKKGDPFLKQTFPVIIDIDLSTYANISPHIHIHIQLDVHNQTYKHRYFEIPFADIKKGDLLLTIAFPNNSS
jgi:hypothetical protein